MIKLEHFLPFPKSSVGRPRCNRQAIAKAFIAKAIHNLPTTRSLIERLNWEYHDSLPNEATFSRVFAEFAESKLTEKIHEKLIYSYQSDRLIEHISRDSTAISAREKPKKKPVEEAGNTNSKRKRGRPKKDDPPVEKALTRIDKQLKMPSIGEMLDDLPKSCDVGAKTNSKGHMLTWCGYKLHIDTADGDIPISCILTSASLHDSQVSIPLAKMTDERVI